MTDQLLTDARIKDIAYGMCDGLAFSIAQIERVENALGIVRNAYERVRDINPTYSHRNGEPLFPTVTGWYFVRLAGREASRFGPARPGSWAVAFWDNDNPKGQEGFAFNAQIVAVYGPLVAPDGSEPSYNNSLSDDERAARKDA